MGASIKDVRPKMAFFDPLPPLPEFVHLGGHSNSTYAARGGEGFWKCVCRRTGGGRGSPNAYVCSGGPMWPIALSHLNRDYIESNLSVPAIQGCYENALIKSFEMSPYLYVSSLASRSLQVYQLWKKGITQHNAVSPKNVSILFGRKMPYLGGGREELWHSGTWGRVKMHSTRVLIVCHGLWRPMEIDSVSKVIRISMFRPRRVVCLTSKWNWLLTGYASLNRAY